MRVMILAAAIAALAFASTAEAKSCKDAKGHYTKCPASAAAPAKPAAAPAAKPAAMASAKPTMSKTKAGTTFKSTGAPDKCKTGIPCGKSCIPRGKVCHK